MAAGVLATGNSTRVAAFTLLSVVCAESMTATSSSNGELCTSSVVGFGFAARSRRKMAARVAGRTACDLARRPLARGDEGGALPGPRSDSPAVGAIACTVVLGGRCRRRLGEARARHHRDAVDRTGCDAELAPGAEREHDGVHLFARAHDRIDGAGRQATGAADAGFLVALCHELRPLHAV